MPTLKRCTHYSTIPANRALATHICDLTECVQYQYCFPIGGTFIALVILYHLFCSGLGKKKSMVRGKDYAVMRMYRSDS